MKTTTKKRKMTAPIRNWPLIVTAALDAVVAIGWVTVDSDIMGFVNMIKFWDPGCEKDWILVSGS